MWTEYPRPQMRRERWINLCGEWGFAFDDRDAGLRERWYELGPAGSDPFDRVIDVPYAWQARLSGVGGDPHAVHDVVWYRLRLDEIERSERDRVIVHFDAVDYDATVWVNGRLVGAHAGGHSEFSADVTDALASTGNYLVVRAQDYAHDPSLPRGKQDWRPQPSGIHYTRTTGIYGPVWAEVVDRLHIATLRLTPDVDGGSLELVLSVAGGEPGAHVRAAASIDGQPAGAAVLAIARGTGEAGARIDLGGAPLVLWEPAPGRPALYDLALEVLDGEGVVRDRVDAYFGMRKVEVIDGRIFVNGTERFLRGVLDQRWDPNGLLTPPSDEAQRREIELALACGFNFVRVHQRRENMRYYAWADRLGLLLSGEAPSAFHFTPAYVQRMTSQWIEIVGALVNTPSIILWLPINESWGCRTLGSDGREAGPFEADHAGAMYHLTRSLDPTRPCASNDGWEHTESDFTGVHDYSPADQLREHVRQLDSADGIHRVQPGWGHPLYVDGYQPPGGAAIYTEFGGLFRGRHAPGIGYSVYTDDEDFYRRFADLISIMVTTQNVAGFVYTQWRDVETETNGLLDAGGALKWNIDRIRSAVGSRRREPGGGA